MTKDASWRDRIVKDPPILAGKPRVKGTRISVKLIVELLDGAEAKPTSFAGIRTLPRKTSGRVNVTWADIDAMMDGRKKKMKKGEPRDGYGNNLDSSG